MFLGHKVRRRVSKKWVVVWVLAGVAIYHLSLVLYYRLTNPVKVELVNNVNVILQPQEHQDHGDDRIKDPEDPQPDPDHVPEPAIKKTLQEKRDHFTINKKKLIPRAGDPMKQSAKSLENILTKMEKTMNKDDLKLQNDLADQPDPATMLQHQVGPVSRLSSQNIPKERKAKIIVIARKGSGYPVLGQFFSQRNGFFVHGEPPAKSETVLNLINCVLEPEMVHNFSDLILKDFGKTSYFTSSCLLDSDSVCSDPLSYENKCSTFPYQVLKSNHFSLTFAKDLMESESDIKVVYLVRDPRGVLRNSKTKPGQLCEGLSRDWDVALGLVSHFPQQFHLVRYEELARAPLAELTALLRMWDISLELGEELSLVQEEAEDAWSLKRNPVQKVNSWKTGLTSGELRTIENRCSETISKMEYQLIGSL